MDMSLVLESRDGLCGRRVADINLILIAWSRVMELVLDLLSDLIWGLCLELVVINLVSVKNGDKGL